ncbi:IclR family transcriptional regulator [Chelatococcus asaccharovorans]|uniref:IclR family transcriptional regulator n=2 Tax=Chelatococcus asaccharovorans TaxID=28210 RepID=A0A2V3UJJ7_9HYPH|nr:IclR family transcriptional regulator [Chelatococcus asaccharovorans]MBS7706340.1 IclR family transcriptional regulator [Chelatococcus asaccharovorans]PXW65017.1 IclR family transcriptional regulator [Chelatococcus asaccharovorans]CAH1661240.1 IclR family transcriptional regulator [Chelatococcus asaccharovorans]CAH1683537.1 IclR family transcriptional regulator [Chelatococcus asaccharovorans]
MAAAAAEDQRRAAPSRPPEVKTLAKGLAVIDHMLERGPVRTTDLAQHLGIDKGTASRLLQTLVVSGYVRLGEGRAFELTEKMVRRKSLERPERSLRERARPLLERIAAETGEAVHLSIPADDRVLYIDTIESNSPLRVDRPAGTLAPLDCTAMGRILLAHLPLAIPLQLQKRTENTIADPVRFAALLDTIREQGYALDDEEYHLGIRCAAAALREQDGTVVGAIGVSGPTVRMAREDLRPLGERLKVTASAFLRD